MDFDPLIVADGQQRRIVPHSALLEQLVVGRVKVLVLAFVFPAEILALPDVLAAVPGDLPKDEPVTLGVGFRRLGVVKHLAEILKMLPAGASIRKRGTTPFNDELLRGNKCPLVS